MNTVPSLKCAIAVITFFYCKVFARVCLSDNHRILAGEVARGAAECGRTQLPHFLLFVRGAGVEQVRGESAQGSFGASVLTRQTLLSIQYPYAYTLCGGWRCGSVVRTSVFGWRIFPDLYPICG